MKHTNWWTGNRKDDGKSSDFEELVEQVIDYRTLPPSFYLTALDAQANCVYCCWLREERRKSYRKKRVDFCILGSPWWPTAAECFLYRVRPVPMTGGGWDGPKK